MAPRTVAGRLLAVVWMIAGVVLISALTAAITSALTVSQLSSSVNGIEDLRDRAVATVAGSAGHDYLRERGIPTIALPSLDECMSALGADEVWGVVHDEPLLRYFALSRPDLPIHVQAEKLQSRGYGIGLPRGSPLREPLNRFLLKHVTTPRWNAVVLRHLGR